LTTALLFGCVSWVLLDIGIAVQKGGLTTNKRRTMNRGLIWALGVLMTGISILFSYLAVALSDSSVFASLAGIGLAGLVVFSFFVLKEKLNGSMVIGILIIGIGTVLFTSFAREMAISSDLMGLMVFVVIVVLISIVVTFISLGIVAGILAGLGIVLQKYVTEANSLANQLLFFVGWGILTGISFLVTQLALVKGKAVNVVPSYNSAKVTLPQIAAMFLFADTINSVQLVGLGLILVGIVLLTHYRGE
jgi:uncharacterized membrane protein